MEKLSRLQDLIKKTGDKIVLLSEFDDNDLIIMPLAQYEKIIEPVKTLKDMDEKELLNRINRDINLWKENQAEKEWDEEFDFNQPWSNDLENFDKPITEEDDYDLAPPTETFKPKESKEKNFTETELKKSWSEEISTFSDLEPSETEEIPSTPISPENNVINYEHIPPPPDIIMPREEIEPQPEKIIDLSLENDPLTENNEFDEEPVY